MIRITVQVLDEPPVLDTRVPVQARSVKYDLYRSASQKTHMGDIVAGESNVFELTCVEGEIIKLDLYGGDKQT